MLRRFDCLRRGRGGGGSSQRHCPLVGRGDARDLGEKQARAFQVMVDEEQPHAAAVSDLIRLGKILLRLVPFASVTAEGGTGEQAMGGVEFLSRFTQTLHGGVEMLAGGGHSLFPLLSGERARTLRCGPWPSCAPRLMHCATERESVEADVEQPM